MTRSTLLGRLLPVVALLVVGGLAWWAMGDGDRTGSGDAVTRDTDRETPHAARGESPLLRGASDAEASTGAVASGPPVSGDEEAKPWRITFEVVLPNGRPMGWTRAMLRGRNGVELAQALYGDPVSSGWLRAPGPGRLVVFTPGFLPWVSELLTRPVGGDEQHLVVRLDPGLAVAGEVLCQDGRTPVKDGTVVVRGRHRVDPEAAPEAFSFERRVPGGAFHLAGLAPGKVEVVASSRGWGDGRPVRVVVAAGSEDLRLVLAPQVIVQVLVVDGATGFAPVTPRVGVERLDEEGRTTRRSETATPEPEEGQEPTPIAIVDAAPGDTLRFRAEAVGYRTRERVELEVPRTGTRFTARIELEPDPASVCHVRLHLRFEGGSPPPSLIVQRIGRPVPTFRRHDLDGQPIPLELAPGPHRLRLASADRPSTEGLDWVPVDLDIDLEPGEERDVDVRLRPGGWVFLTGELAATPEEIHWVGAEGERTSHAHRHATLEGTGYLLGLLPPGLWTFRFGEDEEALTGRVEVRAGEVVRVEASSLQALEPDDAAR